MSILLRSPSEPPTQRVTEFRVLGAKFRTACNVSRDSLYATRNKEKTSLLTGGWKGSRGCLGYSCEGLTKTLEALTKPQAVERPYSASREYQRRSLSWQRGMQLRPKLAFRPVPRRVLLQVTGANLPRH